ncbi:MAG: hypothetical protein ACREEM_27430, partial [Blastocatellia bacterium]
HDQLTVEGGDLRVCCDSLSLLAPALSAKSGEQIRDAEIIETNKLRSTRNMTTLLARKGTADDCGLRAKGLCQARRGKRKSSLCGQSDKPMAQPPKPNCYFAERIERLRC